MKNCKWALLLFMLIACHCAFAQTFPIHLQGKVLKNHESFTKGESVQFVSYSHDFMLMAHQSLDLFFIQDAKERQLKVDNKLSSYCEFCPKTVQDIWDAHILLDVLPGIQKKGVQSELRQEMEDDALQYIGEVERYGILFEDPYLESYIYGLIAKIAPKYYLDGRQNSLNIVFLQDPSTNAFTYPNGTIVLNTGLLAALHTEDELVAVLAHEIAHYVLDHGVQNVNKALVRQRRAEFWAGLATGLTAVAEGVAAANNDYYMPGLATLGVSAVSTALATQINKRLGMEFNHEQELEADKLSCQILRTLGYDPGALSSFLNRVQDGYMMLKNNSYVEESPTHPSLAERITRCGPFTEKTDIAFEQMVSFAISNIASINYINKKFSRCIQYTTQNINNHVATADDYLLKANCLLSMENTAESNQEVMSLIQQAKQLSPGNINSFKIEILVALRMHQRDYAISLLNDYIQRLLGMDSPQETVHNDVYLNNNYPFVSEEVSWAKRMLIKLNGMCVTL